MQILRMEEQAVKGLPWHELTHWERETTSTVGCDEVSQTPHKERAELDGPRVHNRGLHGGGNKESHKKKLMKTQ